MSDEQKFIIVYSPYLPPYKLSVAHRMRHFIEALEDSGYIVNVITGKAAHWGKSLWLDLPSKQPGLIMSTLRETLSGIELALRIILMKEPCVLISSPPLITAFFAALGARLSNKFYFLDIRDLQPDIYIKTGKLKDNSLFASLLRKVEKWVYQKAAVVFTSTRRIKNYVLNLNPKLEGRIFAIWNGFDEENFAEFSDKPNNFKIIYHGNFGPLNNVLLLRKVAQKLLEANIEVQIDCAGVGPHAALLKAAKLPNIKVIPPIKESELCRTISSYHLALSLRNDAEMGETDFPSKVFECIGSGVPVLVTPKCEAGQYLSESGAGIQFDNKDGEQIVDAIKSFFANPDSLRKMNENAMKLREQLGKRRLRQAMVQVLDQL